MAAASIHALEATVSHLQEEIAKLRSELDALKSKEDIERDDFLRQMAEMNARIRQFQQKASVVLAERCSGPPSADVKQGQNGSGMNETMDSEAVLTDSVDEMNSINAQVQVLEEEYQMDLLELEKLRQELSDVRAKRALMECVIKETKQLQELKGRVAELKSFYNSLAEELQRQYTCAGCGANNMAAEEMELRGSEVQASIAAASIQALEAATSLLQEEIVKLSSELDALKSKEDIERDEFLRQMVEMNATIRQFQQKASVVLAERCSGPPSAEGKQGKSAEGENVVGMNKTMDAEAMLTDSVDQINSINAEVHVLEGEYQTDLLELEKIDDSVLKVTLNSRPTNSSRVKNYTIAQCGPHIFVLLAIMGMLVSATAGGTPACQASSLATNIREYCSSDIPSDLCCEALQAAATGSNDGQISCFCMVGEEPDIITMGSSAENLIRLHNWCTHGNEGFYCDETEIEGDTSNLKHDGTTIEEYVAQADQHEEMTYPWNPHEEDDKPYVEDDTGEKQGHTKHQHRGKPSSGKEDETPNEDHQHGSPNYFAIARTAGVLILLGGFLIASLVAYYKRGDRMSWRQVLTIAAAAALGLNPANGVLPVQAPGGLLPVQAPGLAVQPPAIPPLPLVNGIPQAQVQAPPLAIFPRPADIMSLLTYAVWERARRTLWA